ncbi:DUF2167 domain-containing protein [bacterium]|nr:DUF2167 domain-containing protein [bacterium]
MLHRFKVLLLLAGLTAVPALAQSGPDAEGPTTLTLAGTVGKMDLPKGYVWIGESKAKELIKKNGGSGENVIGLILPNTKNADFAVELKYEDTGYVEDKDAGKLDAKEILKSYQEGTEAQNEERKEKGMAALHVTGWEQEPSYDPKTHVVIWSLQGENDSKEQFVNYNTRVLTRKGVLSVNLMCDNKDLPAVKPKSEALVKKISFNQGERYEDFKTGDKISAGGLAALIVGGALLAKKGGLLGFLFVMLKPLLLAFKALGAKVVVLIGAAIAYVGKAIFGRKKNQEDLS